MSNWTMEEVDALTSRRNGGNEAALHTWLQNAPPVGGKYSGGCRPKAGDRVEVYKQFILDCYEHGKFKSSGQTEQKVLQNDAEALPSHRSSAGRSLPSRQTPTAFQSDSVSGWSFENQVACDNSFHAFDFSSSLSANEGTAGFATFPSQMEPPSATSVKSGIIFPEDIFNFTSTSSVVQQSKPPPTVPTSCFDDDPFGNDLLVPVSSRCAPAKSRDLSSVDGFRPPSLGYAPPSNSLDSQGIFAPTYAMTKSDTGPLFFASTPLSAPVGIMGQQGPYAPGPAMMSNNGTTGARVPSVTMRTTESVPYGRGGSYGYGSAPASSVSSAFSSIGNSSNTKQSNSFDFLEDALKQQLR